MVAVLEPGQPDAPTEVRLEGVDEDGRSTTLLAVATNVATASTAWSAVLAVPRLATIGGGDAVSITFVLRHRPGPNDRLAPLVERAVVAMELDATPSAALLESVSAAHRVGPLLATSTTFELCRGTEIVAGQRVDGPFVRGAFQATLDGPVAQDLLLALTGGDVSMVVKASVAYRPATTSTASSSSSRLSVDLGRTWQLLDERADETRLFYERDLSNYLATLFAEGALAPPSVAPTRAIAGLLKAARFFLRATGQLGDGLGAEYVLANDSPGDQEVSISLPDEPATEGSLLLTVELADLLAGRLQDDPERVVSFVTLDNGRVDALLPVVRDRAASRGLLGTNSSFFVAHGDRIESAPALLRPAAHLSTTAPLLRPPVGTMLAAQVQLLHPVELVPSTDRRPGPIVDDPSAPLWADRWDAGKTWFAPTFVLERPEPSEQANAAPYSFEVQPEPGHTSDGAAAMSATVTMHVRKDLSAATRAEWEARGRPELSEVTMDGLTAHLTIPFRDENGQHRTEVIGATEVVPEGELIRVVFRLLDRWARLAYGALSVPGFQTEPPRVSFSYAFEGWTGGGGDRPVVGLHKRWELERFEPLTMAPTRALDRLAGGIGHISPVFHIDPDALAALNDRQEWSRFVRSESIDVVVPCVEHPDLYRERGEGGSVPIGCRPALQLGQTEYRTYQPMVVDAAFGFADVYRSLRVPGRFLVVPDRYAIGRYEPTEGEHAYRPMLLLQSTLDADEPTDVRCVLAASLQPDLPPFRRELILAELRRTAHPDPVLEGPFEAGLDFDVRWAVPSGIELTSTASALGFDVVMSTDLRGFLALRTILERVGLTGSATARLPGGVALSSTLQLGLGMVTGPFVAGAIEGHLDGSSAVLTNRIGRTVAVTGIHRGGAIVVETSEVLAPGAQTRVGLPDGVGAYYVVYAVQPGHDALEEVRAYVEDLEVGVLFLLLGNLPADIGGLDVTTRLAGDSATTLLRLTNTSRSAQRSFLLPLTTFAADPAVEYQIGWVDSTGATASNPWVRWPLRANGAVIEVRPPSSQPPAP